MKIALGSDHRGAELLLTLAEHLREHGYEPLVLASVTSEEPSDYPEAAYRVGTAVRDGAARFGMLVCGSGIGMSIAANKVEGVRAGLCEDAGAAEMTRRHNDANVLCVAADRRTPADVRAIADAFLAAPFDGGRHDRRVRKITAIERGEDPSDTTATERRSDEATEGGASERQRRPSARCEKE